MPYELITKTSWATRPMISVVLATYNEAHNLERCLLAVREWADEIIVVDGSSPDGTADLAKKLGAKVFSTTNKANFHINKQQAMDKAKGDLVLQLDADEVVDDELAAFIKRIHLSYLHFTDQDYTAQQLPVAWWIKRRNFFLGQFLRKGGQYPDPVIRLYIKGYAKLPQKDVHEQMTVKGEIGWAEGHLLHYPNPSFSVYLEKWDRYTSFKAEQLRAAGVKFSWRERLYYIIWLPKITFLSLYFRHKGFLDGVPGFVFALFSALYHPLSYLKLWELTQKKHA